ncbi:rCG54352, isoform CRA_b [Rattus norvegicus]|uniref:RCG54352, isoform CRA_b n=1 Tax=Rattus norvegicus TaxID=10116 RepID=A6J8P4_RAT|nr:rCG54352, isoform CRA_b [Rattus norvegicus]
MPSSSCAKICGRPCSKSIWTDSAPTTSSWPSPAASCAAPSILWASRAWSLPPWRPCPPVSSRW